MELTTIIWTGLILVFLIVEAACPIHLVSLWFAAGSLAALIVSALHGPLWLQITLFITVSAGLLALLWPFVRKFLNPGLTATNVDAVIGTIAVVTAPIDNVAAQGQVKLNGMEWSARSSDGTDIPVGIRVRVDRVEGVKVYVTPTEVPAVTQ